MIDAAMPLDLESLRDAVARLDEALGHSRDTALLDGLPPGLERVIKAGVIKHFEFTYGLSWKFIKRWLEVNISPDTADGATRRELFRYGAEHRLIDDAAAWMRYHRARNLTSHTYQQATADAVLTVVPDFLADAQSLLAALESRND